jgi:multimeric flavodoxin WrbA
MKALGINCSPRKGGNSSPVYHADLSAHAKALVEVSSYALGSAGKSLRYKPGAAVIAVRRSGAVQCRGAQIGRLYVYV